MRSPELAHTNQDVKGRILLQLVMQNIRKENHKTGLTQYGPKGRLDPA